MTVECRYEQDVLDAIASNRWPGRCDDDLRQHVAGCADCRDTIAVVAPLLDEHDRTLDAVRVPAASVVWWRAQLRARQEAARVASWPITIAQGGAVVTILVAAAAFVSMGWARIDVWQQSLAALAGRVVGDVTIPAFVSQHAMPLALAAGTFLIVAPLVVYLTVSDE